MTQKRLNLIFITNAYPPFLTNKVIKKYLNYKSSTNQNQLKDKSEIYYFKLPYIGNLLHHIKNKRSKLCKDFCKENFNIKLAFTSFKIKNYFSYIDPIPNVLKFFLVYKFTCGSCSSSYIGETCHFKTRTEQHIKKNNKFHIFKHLNSTATLYFKRIDKANSKFDLEIKEALHIIWKKPNLNEQQNHLTLALSLQLLSPCSFLSFVYFFYVFCLSFFFFLRFSSIYFFHCLNYTSQLLHLFITHLVKDFAINM